MNEEAQGPPPQGDEEATRVELGEPQTLAEEAPRPSDEQRPDLDRREEAIRPVRKPMGPPLEEPSEEGADAEAPAEPPADPDDES
jgi:hypothetical protein